MIVPRKHINVVEMHCVDAIYLNFKGYLQIDTAFIEDRRDRVKHA